MKETTQTANSTILVNDCGKIPPQVVDFEEYVLGSLLCGFADFNDVAQILSSEMFYKENHKNIFAAIEKLYTENSPIDIISVKGIFVQNNRLNDIGGEQYLIQLSSKGTGYRVDYYSRAIFECYIRRELIRANNEIINLSFDISIDLGEAINTAEKQLNDIIMQIAGKKDIEHISTIANIAVDDAWKRINNARAGKITGINTGLAELNKVTVGWQPSKLYILAARPSVGKTSVMLHFTRSAAEQGAKCLVFSLEMSGTELANKLLLSKSELNADRFKSGYMFKEEEQMLETALGNVSKLPVWVDSTANISMNEIHARARAMQKKGKCDIIFIDYLQLSQEQGNTGRNREQAVSAMSREAKIMAKSLNVPVILLSQLSREIEKRGNKAPLLSDLRDSGAIEQDADVVAFLWKPDEQAIKDKPELENCGKIIISKNRDGALKTIKFRHNPEMTKIYDYDTLEFNY